MENNTLTGTQNAAWGGIMLSILGIHWQDLLQTIILGIVGTVVSLCTSIMLKKMKKK